jgi:alpha-tubulin suppressor-like RCC1 family protein
MNTTDDEKTTTLSQETILKIQELKKLIYRYSQYHHNPAAVLSCIVYYCNNGDNTLLDEKLEQLRTFDSAMGYTRMQKSTV